MDTTLNNFRALTSTLGRSVRIFINEVCLQYETTEVPHELATRGRRAAAIAKKSDSAGPSHKKKTGTSTRKRKRKQLNLSTYKYHALGDYPDQIAQFGGTDNTSTQTVRYFL